MVLRLLPMGGVLAAAPDAREIGRILGYPGGGLVVEEVTDSEREIYVMPTQREKRRNLEPPLEAGRIVSAYRITGAVPSSFFPVLVLVTREGRAYA